jgi:dihydroorotate dehydrogenase electron transfer subunit
MNQSKAEIVFNHQVAPDCHHLGLACEGELLTASPGQFVMVQVGADAKPLLRRPFSIYGRMADPGRQHGIELLIKVVGQGTRLLAVKPVGDSVDLIGPLGHGFRVDSGHQRVYLAAGGIGIAPIRFLATELVARGMDPKRIHLFLGGRSQSDLLCREDFKTMGIPLTVTTDDGSDGDQCLITDPLQIAIQQRKPDMVYACGPPGMLACIAGIVRRCQVSCQVSVETMMACGMGVCLGCAVQPRQPQEAYWHACIHGPVFNLEDLSLDENAPNGCC